MRPDSFFYSAAIPVDCLLTYLLTEPTDHSSHLAQPRLNASVAIWSVLRVYHAKYLRMSWTYLDLLYRFCRHISGDDFVWRSPKGRCYGNQLNMGHVRKGCVELPLLFSSTFKKGLADRKSAFNGNNQATLYLNLVNFRAAISEFSLLKRAIFAAICPQFDDDLYSSSSRFQTDWKIAILISAK